MFWPSIQPRSRRPDRKAIRRVRRLVRQDTDAVQLPRLLRLNGKRRNNKTDDENDREPDQPHVQLGEVAGGESSPTPRRAPARHCCRCRSVPICVPVDHRAAGTRHPHAVAVDPAVQLAAVLVLLEESLEGVEERHATLVEYVLLDHLGRLEEQGLWNCQPERLGRLEIDAELEFRGLLDR